MPSSRRKFSLGISLKLLIVGEIVLLVAVLAMLIPLRREMRHGVIDNLQNELQSIAATGALQIDGDLIKQIRSAEDAKSPAFAQLRQIIARIRDANGIDEGHIYTFYRDAADANRVRFGVMTHAQPFVGDPYELRDEMRTTFEDGCTQVTDLYTDVNGEYISAYAPIRDRAGSVVAILEVDKPASKYLLAYRRVTQMNVAVGAAVLAMSSLLGWWILNSVVIQPMRAVRTAIAALAEQDFRHRVRLKTHDEFQELGDALNRMSEQLNVARSVQRSFFPKDLPQQGGYRIAAHTEACEATAGDYVDAFAIDENRTAIVVADVTGHGLGPSLLMAACRAALHALAVSQLSPREIVTRLDELLASDLTEGRFITMIFGIIESDGTFTFTNAGHGPAMIAQGGETIDLDAHRPPLGVGLDEESGETSIVLEAGDRILLCSDGVSEAMDAAGEQFGSDRIARIVANHRIDADEVISRISSDIREYSGRSIMKDDVTILCVDRIAQRDATDLSTPAAFETVPG